MSAVSLIRSWWGAGWNEGEFTVPSYQSLSSAQSSLLDPGYDSKMRLRYKSLATGQLARAFDKYEVGVTLSPFEGPQTCAAGIDAKGFTYEASFLGGSLRVFNPRSANPLPVVSLDGAYNLPLEKPTGGTFINGVFTASVKNAVLECCCGTKGASSSSSSCCSGGGCTKGKAAEVKSGGCGSKAPELETHADAGVMLRYLGGTVGARLAQSKPAGQAAFGAPQLLFNGSLGVEGCTVGAESQVDTKTGDVVDFRTALQYARKDALAVTVETRNNFEDLVLTKLAYFGSGKQQLSVGASATTSFADPCGGLKRYSAGLQYDLPADILHGGIVKAKYDSGEPGRNEGRVTASVWSAYRPLGLGMGFNVSAPTACKESVGACIAGKNVKFGLSFALGDNFDEPDVPPSKGASLSSPVGPACCALCTP